MSKTTEALKLAAKALSGDYAVHPDEALAAIREALAEPEITTPDVCGEVCARAKLCYGCGKALDEANAKLADHSGGANEMVAEPAIPEWVDVDDYEEPVKQEPVIWHSVLDFADVRRDPPEQGDEANWLPLYAIPEQTINQTPAAYVEYYDEGLKRKPLYAEPVDAKAIRAEALEEAAKWFEGKVGQADLRDIAAAIRSMK